MGKNVPCYMCDNRTETCHGSCQLYIDWSNKKAEEREARLNSPENEIIQCENLRKYKFSRMKKYK